MQAAEALNVEPVNVNIQIIVTLDVLLTRIKFLTLVDIFIANLALHVEQCHQSHNVSVISRQFYARDLRQTEIRRIVFLKYKKMGDENSSKNKSRL